MNAVAFSLPGLRDVTDFGRVILQLYNTIYEANDVLPAELKRPFAASIAESNRLIQLGQAQVMRTTRVRMDTELFRVIDVWVQQTGDTFLIKEWAKLAPRLWRAIQGGK